MFLKQGYLFFTEPDQLVPMVQQVKLVLVEQVALRVEVVGLWVRRKYLW